MTDDDERLLQDLLCGDVSEHDAGVAARLAAAPQLRTRLDALRAAERELAGLADVPPALRAAARGLAADDDRSRLAAAMRARRPVWRRGRVAAFALVGLAAAVLLVFLIGGERAPVDGRLGGAAAVTLQQRDGHRTLVIADALPPGTSYALRLDLADGTSLTATGDARTWQLPDAWNEAIRRARAGTLTVRWDDGTGLVVQHTLSLP